MSRCPNCMTFMHADAIRCPNACGWHREKPVHQRHAEAACKALGLETTDQIRAYIHERWGTRKPADPPPRQREPGDDDEELPF